MKQKTLLKMLSTGVHRHFPEPEGSRIAERSAQLYSDYCREHQDDPPAVKAHTEGVIFAGVALYRAIQESGKSPEEALALTDEIFQDFARGEAKKLQALLKLPGLYRKVPSIFLTMAKKKYNAAAGFSMTFYDSGKGRARLDVTVCPYHNTCRAMGCPELTTIFCNTDDTCYGNLHPKLQWHRAGTLGRGAELCDFDLSIQD